MASPSGTLPAVVVGLALGAAAALAASITAVGAAVLWP
jgi:hypothetical protein